MTAWHANEPGWNAGIRPERNSGPSPPFEQAFIWSQSDLCCLLMPQKVNRSMKRLCKHIQEKTKFTWCGYVTGQPDWLDRRWFRQTPRGRTLAQSFNMHAFTLWKCQWDQIPSSFPPTLEPWPRNADKDVNQPEKQGSQWELARRSRAPRTPSGQEICGYTEVNMHVRGNISSFRCLKWTFLW